MQTATGYAQVDDPPANDSVRDVWILVGAYSLLYAAIAYLMNTFVVTQDVMMKEFEGIYPEEDVGRMVAAHGRWAALGYVFIPFGLLMRVGYSALCVATGMTVAERSVRFRSLFRAALHAEVVFVVAAVIHVAWALFVLDVETPFDVFRAYPLSALNFVSLQENSLWMAYALKTLNLFELIYVVVLARCVGREAHREARLPLVAVSYGTGLLLLVGGATFIALYVS